MNNIEATITEIKNIDNLHTIKFDFFDNVLSMFSLQLLRDIKIGSKVLLAIKPSHITIAKNFTGMISYLNKFNAIVKEIDKGKFLTSVLLEAFKVDFETIMTVESLEKLDLKLGEEVTIFIKASDISLLEILDD